MSPILSGPSGSRHGGVIGTDNVATRFAWTQRKAHSAGQPNLRFKNERIFYRPGDQEMRVPSFRNSRRKRFKLHNFLTTVELTAFRLTVTGSFLYCLYRVFMHEIGR
jgi:hypothetical protein